MRTIDLKGKKALVIGGSQGIGAEICRELAACGADVFINCYLQKEKGKLIAKEIREKYKVKAHVYCANVSQSKDVKDMFAAIDKEIGALDILVNNAGTESVIHVLDMDEKEWDRVLGINLKGPFLCSAKAGLKMPSKCLSLELAESNIRVVSVVPGGIETEMNRKEIIEFGRDKFNSWIPSGRLGDVGEVAQTVAFLASDMASYINGSDIYIDGAYLNNTIQYDPRPPRKE